MYLGVIFNGDFVEFMLIDDSCNIHGKQKEHYIDLIHDGVHEFRGMIESGVARICLKAGISFKEIIFAYFAVPEYGEAPEYDEALNRVLRLVFPEDNFICENDVESALTAAFGLGQGIVVLLGVGSVAMGRNYKQESLRSGGWGRIAGDEAGEYWFAKNILEIFTKEADGRYDSRVLYWHLKNTMQMDEDTSIAHFSFDHLEYYGLSFDTFLDILFEAAEKGDPYANEIISRGVNEIVMMIESLGDKLDYHKPIPVALIGKLFTSKYPIYDQIHDYFINDTAYTLKAARMSLVAGAALKALLFRATITERIILNLIREELRLLSIGA